MLQVLLPEEHDSKRDNLLPGEARNPHELLLITSRGSKDRLGSIGISLDTDGSAAGQLGDANNTGRLLNLR